MGLFSSILDVFGLGSNLLGTAMDYKAVKDTNKTNLQIAEKNNQTAIDIHNADMAFNKEEAEKSRQFQSDEAQKTREWNSEQAVMERRRQAGLNTAVLDGNVSSPTSSPSGAQASAPSAPTLQIPTMQAPQIGDGISNAIRTAIDLAKAPSEIKETETNIAKSEKEIDSISSEIGLRSAQETAQRIANAKDMVTFQTEVETFKEQLTNLRKQNSKINVDTYFSAATTQQTQEAIVSAIMANWQQIHMNKFNQHLNIAQMEKDIVLEAQRLDTQCQLAFKQMREDRLKYSFDVGAMVKQVKNNMKNNQWHINGNASVDIGNSLTPVSGSLGVDGGYESGNVNSFGSETLQRYQNSMYMDKAIKLKLQSIYLMRRDVPFVKKLEMLDKYTNEMVSLHETLKLRDVVKSYLGNTTNIQPVTLPSQYLD